MLCHSKQQIFLQWLSYHLETNREIVKESYGKAKRGQSSEIHRNGVQIHEIHCQRVSSPLPDLEGKKRAWRSHNHIHLLKRLVKIFLQKRANLLRFEIV